MRRPRLPDVIQLLSRHARGLAGLFLGIFLPLGIFAFLARDVLEREDFWWDRGLLEWFQGHATPGRETFMLWASRVGVWFGVVPFSIVFFLWLAARRRTAQALFFALSMIGAGVLNAATKRLFGRPRPALWASIAPEQSYSFPSGHTMGSMALATSLAVLAWPTRWRWPVIAVGAAAVLAISSSRLYLGVHYPSDVLAGWMASLAWVLGLKQLLLRSV
jgi:membrane-associated phospholipid phosphatase